ncbi:Disheveled-associated activator of morphogenesis [Trichinella pseudospiralis]
MLVRYIPKVEDTFILALLTHSLERLQRMFEWLQLNKDERRLRRKTFKKLIPASYGRHQHQRIHGRGIDREFVQSKRRIPDSEMSNKLL